MRLLIITLAATLLLSAQTRPGGLRGTVSDTSGAVIPAAEVRVSGNNVRKTTRTQADGSYGFAGLAPGSYKVAVSWPGFTAYEQSMTIESGAIAQLPIQLSPAAGKQEVNVTAEADAVSVEPDHNASATVVKGSDLEALPDDPDDLTDMIAALAGPTADGNDASIRLDGFPGGTLPPKNTIKEIRLSQNPFSADTTIWASGGLRSLRSRAPTRCTARFRLPTVTRISIREILTRPTRPIT